MTTHAFERDRDRDQRLNAHRWWSFRTTSKQLTKTPDVVGPRLLAVIEIARSALRAA